MQKSIAIGTGDFRKLIESDSYYVDKTAFLKYFMTEAAEVTVITRPRRFGKTLTLSMIECFLSVNLDKEIQRGLFRRTEIFKDTEFCAEYMGKFPVISLSFKGVAGETSDLFHSALADLISKLTGQHEYLLQSDRLDEDEKNIFHQCRTKKSC